MKTTICSQPIFSERKCLTPSSFPFSKVRQLVILPICVASLSAQTVVPSGTTTTESQSGGEELQVATGTTVNVNGSPAILLNDSGATLTNAGALTTQGVTQTVESAANNTTINNQAGGTIRGASRAVDITSGNGATINNAAGAVIEGTGNQRNGTFYADGDTNDVTLNNAGRIDAGVGNEGSGAGFEIDSGGNTFEVDNTGTIQGRGNASAATNGAGDGIRIGNVGNIGTARAEITNSGTIASEGANGTVGGVRFVNGISFEGTLDNSGTISGTQNGVYFGNAVAGEGADHSEGVVNNSGTISSGSRAFNLDGTGLTVNNSGNIVGTGNQRNGTFYADGTAQDFTVNNQGGGLIDAGAGNEGSGLGVEIGTDGNTFTIDNTGTIQGRGNASAATNGAGDGIRIGNVGNIGTARAEITNSGTIASEGANGTVGGVRFVNGISFEGTLDNSGTISGTQNGVYFGNAVAGEGADHSNGVVNNSGTISSGSRAFNLDGTGLTVNNSGNIVGTGNQRNGTFYADGTAQDFTVNNQEGGLIDAGAGNEGSGLGVEIGADGNTFTIDNTGTIQGRGNASAATNGAGDGIRIGNVGNIGTARANITNSGTIASEGANGTVGGVRFVNGISFEGTLDNSGTISGTQNGVYFGNAVAGEGADHSNGVVNNSGTISSGSRAFNLDGSGLTVNNSGNIVGTGNQRNGTFYADGTAQDFTVNNQEGGLIDAGAGNEGSGLGVEIGADGNTFTIDNTGTIQGRGNASAATNGAGDGMRIGNVGDIGTARANITNSGTIASEGANGTVSGVRFVNGVSFDGTFNNSGTISGVQNGLYFGNPVAGEGADHSNGVVNNLEGGTISSGSRALNIDGNGLTVNNAGQIVGAGDQRNGTVYFDGTATNATFRNATTGVVDSGTGNQGSGVSIQADTGSRSHLVENNGLIQGRGAALPSGAAAGVRVFGPNSAQTDIDIINGASGTIASEDSAGVLVEGVTFQGQIENRGIITGETAAIDTRSALGDITIDQLDGRLEGGVFTGVGDDVLNIGGDSTLVGEIDLGAGDNQVNVLSGANVSLLGTNLDSDLDVDGSLGITVGAPLVVSGATAFNAGSTLNLNVTDFSALDLNAPTVVLNSAGGVTQSNLNVVDSSVLTDFNIATTANTIQAQAVLADVDGLFEDSNVTSLASALQSAIVSGADATILDVIGTLDGLSDPVAFEAGAAGVLPDLNVALTREVYENQSFIFDAIDTRLSARGVRPNGTWAQAFGRFSSNDSGGSATESDADTDSFGFLLGYDTSFGEGLTGGVAFGYSNLDIDSGLSETDIDVFSFNLYAAYQQDDFYLRGAIAYAFGDAESDRASVAGDIDSDFDLDHFSIRLTAGVDKVYGNHTFSPFVGLEYGNTSQDSFTETGALNLAVSADNVSVLELGVGLGYSTIFKAGDLPVRFSARAGYYYDLLAEERELSARFAGGESFNLVGEEAARGTVELSAALDFELSEVSSFGIGYEGRLNSDFDSHAGFARFRFEF